MSFVLVILGSGCGSTEFGGSSAKVQNGSSAAAPVAPKPAVADPSGSANAVGVSSLPGSPAGVGGAPASTGGTIPPDLPTDSTSASVDSACASNATGGGIFGGLGLPVTPAGPALPKAAPAKCREATELNNFHGTFDLDALTAAGSRNLKLEVDVATYEAPDRIRLLAVDGAGVATVILDTCRLKTSTYGDPTDGAARPPDDSIRSFRPVLPQGTKALRFDFTGSHTPQYLRVVGLCDFADAATGGAPALRPGVVP